MADMETEAPEDPMEALLQKQKKERRELQGKIQSLKKTATKGDKKKKKEVQEEIAKLEQELSAKHGSEIRELKEKSDSEAPKEVAAAMESVEISERPGKVSKAQKRREKKAAEQREREKRILEQEVANETGARYLESEKIKEKLRGMGLALHDVQADGDCLYNAVDHQLKSAYGARRLRLEAGSHIREHKGDYLPFLSSPKTGRAMTEEEVEEYCDGVERTSWGGQIELKALSHVLKRPITVVQADGPPLVMGEEYEDGGGLVVTYHRHIYRLGEHYNSVRPYVEEEP